ncbi:hypothetical protein [Leifsonia sp. 2MCAF36]|uniref:hypothetical protein n=1 Tax=Leifsonia sp. 2MCAF36 TaxID=3232988 RepID=UPI003F9B6CDB
MATTMMYTAKLIDGPLEGKTISTGFLDSGDARVRLEIPASAGSKHYLYVRASGAEREYGSDDGRGGRPTAVSYRYLETVLD